VFGNDADDRSRQGERRVRRGGDRGNPAHHGQGTGTADVALGAIAARVCTAAIRGRLMPGSVTVGGRGFVTGNPCSMPGIAPFGTAGRGGRRVVRARPHACSGQTLPWQGKKQEGTDQTEESNAHDSNCTPCPPPRNPAGTAQSGLVDRRADDKLLPHVAASRPAPESP
jgi:hypothetical protein